MISHYTYKRQQTDKRFVATYMKIYQKMGTTDDVAKLMGCTEQAVYYRKTRLKAIGVQLPDLYRSLIPGLSTEEFEKHVNGLNELVEQGVSQGGQTH